MKRLTLIAPLATLLMGGGLAAAQSPAPRSANDHAAHQPPAPASGAAKGGKQQRPAEKTSAGHGMMGHGTMTGGMMGMCPLMGADAKFEVANTAKGVTITITSDDPKVVARARKMAEAMRLMHEAHAP
jgi:hypothetical protein